MRAECTKPSAAEKRRATAVVAHDGKSLFPIGWAMLAMRILAPNAENTSKLQRLLESAPDYSLRVTGGPPAPNEAHGVFSSLPLEGNFDNKIVAGFFAEQRLIGCADFIRGYPSHETAMIGLLLLSEEDQGKGWGREAYFKIENHCRQWPEIRKMRIAVVATNNIVIPFWKKLGFADSGVRRPYHLGSVHSESLILEKPL